VGKNIRAIVPSEKSVPSEGDAKQAVVVRSPDQVAVEVVQALDFIAERLGLETPHPSTAGRVRWARTVPREFVVSLISSVQRKPDLRILGQFKGAEAREALESIDACRHVSERVLLLLANLNYTAEARWSRVADEAMRLFTTASIIAEDPKEAELAAEVENLRRHLGRKGTRKKKKKGPKTE